MKNEKLNIFIIGCLIGVVVTGSVFFGINRSASRRVELADTAINDGISELERNNYRLDREIDAYRVGLAGLKEYNQSAIANNRDAIDYSGQLSDSNKRIEDNLRRMAEILQEADD